MHFGRLRHAAPARLNDRVHVFAVVSSIAAFVYLAVVTVILVIVDLREHRLPNAVVLPGYVVGLVLLGAASLAADDVPALVRALVGMVAMYIFYALLRLVRPGGMGGGDVKLAGVLGLYLGWTGWASLIVGTVAAFLLGGVFGILLMLSRRATRTTSIPFGPWMLAGAWIGIVVGSALGRWYLGLLNVSA